VAQILRILIDNALTHTPKGTAITVGVNIANESATLVVADDGPGIDPRSRGRVFERFYTGDDVSGSGLGLAIARELAQRMGGTLELRRRRGRTEFELRLPAAAAVRA
jgi:two-component system, OmpR family, sensor kinase